MATMVKKLKNGSSVKVNGHGEKSDKVLTKLGYVPEEGMKPAKAKKEEKPYKTPKRMVKFFESKRTCPECKKEVTLETSNGRKLKYYTYHKECAQKVIGRS